MHRFWPPLYKKVMTAMRLWKIFDGIPGVVIRKSTSVMAIYLCIISFFINSASSEESYIDRIVIADAQGDWGVPSPYLHDRRGPGYVLSSLLFDTLVWKDGEGRFIPALARSWQQDDAGFTFQIDPAAKWHDGRPLTPDDVVFTFDYLRRHPYLSVDASVIRAVSRQGERGVRFDLERPFAPFLSDIAGTMPILPRHNFAGVQNPLRFSDAQALTGSGPYKLKSYDRLQGNYLFEAVPGYYRGTPKVREIAFVKMSVPAAIAELKKGRVDVVTSVPATRLEELTSVGLRVLTYQMSHPVRLKFNFTRDGLADSRVRQGLAHLLDLRRIIETVYLGQADLWNPAGLAPLAAGQGDPYPHDSEKAQALLRAGGWRSDADGAWRTAAGAAVSLTLVATRHFDALVRMVAAQLEEAGIRVTVTLFDQGGFEQRLADGDYDLAIASFSMLGDPDIFRHGIIGTRPDSDHYTEDADLTVLLNAQVFETDPVKRAAMLTRAGELYLRDMPSYAMVSPRRSVGMNDRVRLFFTPTGIGPGIPSVLNKQAFLP